MSMPRASLNRGALREILQRLKARFVHGAGHRDLGYDQYVNGTYMLLFRTEDGRRLQQRVVISR